MSACKHAFSLSAPQLPAVLVALHLSECGESVFFNPGAQAGIKPHDPGLAGPGLMLFVARTAIVRFSLPGPRVVIEAAEAAF